MSKDINTDPNNPNISRVNPRKIGEEKAKDKATGKMSGSRSVKSIDRATSSEGEIDKTARDHLGSTANAASADIEKKLRLNP